MQNSQMSAHNDCSELWKSDWLLWESALWSFSVIFVFLFLITIYCKAVAAGAYIFFGGGWQINHPTPPCLVYLSVKTPTDLPSPVTWSVSQTSHPTHLLIRSSVGPSALNLPHSDCSQLHLLLRLLLGASPLLPANRVSSPLSQSGL